MKIAWRLLSPSPSMTERGMDDSGLLKNELVNLTVPRRHFLLLPICKIDDDVVWLLRGMLQIYCS